MPASNSKWKQQTTKKHKKTTVIAFRQNQGNGSDKSKHHTVANRHHTANSVRKKTKNATGPAFFQPRSPACRASRSWSVWSRPPERHT